MKKFTKVMLITAGVIGITGFGLSIGGVAMGANIRDPYVVERLQSGLKFIDQAEDWDNDWDLDLDEDWDEDDLEDRNDSSALLTEQSVLSGDRTIEAGTVDEIEIDLYYETLYIQAYDGDTIQVKIANDANNKIQVQSNSNQLQIKGKKDSNESTVSLMYPKDIQLQKLDIEVDAGSVEFTDELNVRELDMQIGTGNLLSDRTLTVQEVDMEVGLGSIHLAALDAKDISGECGLGTLEIGLTGKQEEYSYQLECATGEIVIGSESFRGLAGEKKITNPGSSRKVELECGMGDILVHVEK